MSHAWAAIGPSGSNEVDVSITVSRTIGASGAKENDATGGRLRTTIVCFCRGRRRSFTQSVTLVDDRRWRTPAWCSLRPFASLAGAVPRRGPRRRLVIMPVAVEVNLTTWPESGDAGRR